MGWLPTYEDEEESIHIYSYLCDLIESNNPVCLGTDNSNLPQILDISMFNNFTVFIDSVFLVLTAFIMGAFNDEAVEVKGRLVNILKMMQQNNVLERIFSVSFFSDSIIYPNHYRPILWMTKNDLSCKNFSQHKSLLLNVRLL